MSRISFESTESVVRFMNPLKEFAEDARTIQVRRDPLLFPNLFTLGTFHPVIRLCDAHFLKLSDLSERKWVTEAFAVC